MMTQLLVATWIDVGDEGDEFDPQGVTLDAMAFSRLPDRAVRRFDWPHGDSVPLFSYDELPSGACRVGHSMWALMRDNTGWNCRACRPDLCR